MSLLWVLQAYGQPKESGILVGNVLDEKAIALEGATVELAAIGATGPGKTTLTAKDGSFELASIPFGYYRLRISYTGLQTLTIDSLHFRADRFDFNLNDIVLKNHAAAENMEEVVVFAEKPLIQSKDGNITFNAGESALSAGSNASDLLASVPLVAKDPNGRLLVRGKEPKILIDDKPVDLNLQQLQDLLESMPGSAIEKIEVMTNPPAQYANEQGGVINITTKKGKVGISGRLTLSGGSRGKAGTYGNFNYRRRGLSVNVNAGANFNRFEGHGYSIRQNIYKDSASFLNTQNNSLNKNQRPNFRAHVNYDITQLQSLNVVLQFNGNDFHNQNKIEYKNINRLDEVYRLSQRSIQSKGGNYNYHASISYTLKTKRPGEILRLTASGNASQNENNRRFYQQAFYPDYTPSGLDSTQNQLNQNHTKGYNTRLHYVVPLNNKKTSFSAGGFIDASQSDIDVLATYQRKSDGATMPQEELSNDFRFYQTISQMRASVKQVLGKRLSVSAGLSTEATDIRFELYKTDSAAGNRYWSYLPFFNLNKNWNDQWNLTAAYRRTVRRPGINELNPTRDESDPYNIRFGNPGLKPSLAHSFDMVLGKTKNSFYANVGIGFNLVQDIYSQLRDRLSDNTTQITWQNISHRKEYEISTWNGWTINKKSRINISASYTYNQYSQYDKANRKFRDGGSFTSSLNGHYNWTELLNTTSSFTFNRFANPQGSVKSNVSMNIGLQARLLAKKLTATLNLVDPFTQQKNRTFTYGSNFNLESFSATNTRNYQLSLGYNISKTVVKKGKGSEKVKQLLQKPISK